MSFAFEWDVTPTVAFGRLTEAYIADIRRGVRDIADKYAAILEEHMKVNAVWQDRTGEARRSLHTEVEQLTIDMVQIILSHGVSWGVYLELGNAGRFSIIAPTIDEFGPRIWADVVAMLR